MYQKDSHKGALIDPFKGTLKGSLKRSARFSVWGRRVPNPLFRGLNTSIKPLFDRNRETVEARVGPMCGFNHRLIPKSS